MYRRCNTARKVQDLLEVMIGEQGKELMGADAWNAMSAKGTCPAPSPAHSQQPAHSHARRAVQRSQRSPSGLQLCQHLAAGIRCTHPPCIRFRTLCSHGVNP